MIDMRLCERCKPNPITDTATLYFDPEKHTGIYVVENQNLWDGKRSHRSWFSYVNPHYANEIFEILNDEEHNDVIDRFFRPKDSKDLYPIVKVNILMWALKMGRMPLDTIDRFNKNGYFYDGKIGG